MQSITPAYRCCACAALLLCAACRLSFSVMREAEMESKIQWGVRGVDKDLARRFVDRAASQRRPTGDVLNEVLRAYLDRSEDPTLPAAGASSGSEGAELVKLVEKHQRVLPDILA